MHTRFKRRLSTLGFMMILSGSAASGACRGDKDSAEDKGDGDEDLGGYSSDEGDGDGDGDGAPLTLESHYPEAGDQNAHALRPLTLTFSSAVDPKTVEEAIMIQSGGESLPFTVSVDKAEVLITLNSIPPLPARISVAVSSDLKSMNDVSFVGDSWSFTYPLWQTPPSLPVSEGGSVFALVGQTRTPMIVRAVGDELAVSLEVDGEFVAGAAPETTSGATLSLVSAHSTSDGVALIWKETEGSTASLFAAVYQDDEWVPVTGTLPSGSSLLAAGGVDAEGAPVVAVASGSNVSVFSAALDTWEELGSGFSVTSAVSEIAISTADDAPVVAVVNQSGDIEISEWQSGWVSLGTPIDRERTSHTCSLSVTKSSAGIYVAYLDGDEQSNNVQVAKFDSDWAPFGAALDLIVDAETSLPVLALDPDGTPLIAWVEDEEGAPQLLAARAQGTGFRVLGTAVPLPPTSSASKVAISSDRDGFAHVLLENQSGVSLSRFNGSPSFPAALSGRGDRGSCNIPENSPSFPQTLRETGCYENLVNRTLVSAAIPFNINSILWSDGAQKKRYLMLPEEGEIMYTTTGALDFPVGTLLIKEFYLEADWGNADTRFPVETRFLIKRCQSGTAGCSIDWEGYSYKWRANGSDADLLEGDLTESLAWKVDKGEGPVDHFHVYPSRASCTADCHTQAAGRVLGLQAAQLNRALDYNGVIENQLRVWSDLGLFGESAPTTEPEDDLRLPSPADVGRSISERTRSYFHSNCSHCHRPGGSVGAPDFRYDANALGAEECRAAIHTDDSLPGVIITPGDALQSDLYLRDEARALPIQMPKVATLIPDLRQLKVTARFIDALPGTCP